MAGMKNPWPRPLPVEEFGEPTRFTSAGVLYDGAIQFVPEPLGSGSFGDVYETTICGVGKRVVAKTIQYLGYRESYTDTVREASLGLQLRHPNIAACLGAMQTKLYAVLFFEHVHGIELFECMKTIEYNVEKFLKGISVQLLEALHYIHSASVVHLDLKEDNVMVTSNGHAKIIDFGRAVCLPPGENVMVLRNLMFAHPPEMNDESMGGVDTKADMFFLGRLLFKVLYGLKPFGDIEHLGWKAQNWAIYRGIDTDSIYPDPVSESLNDLASRLLSYYPRYRPTAAEALKHPWFTSDPGYVYPQLRTFRQSLNQNSQINESALKALSGEIGVHSEDLRPEILGKTSTWQSILYASRTLPRRNLVL